MIGKSILGFWVGSSGFAVASWFSILGDALRAGASFVSIVLGVLGVITWFQNWRRNRNTK